MQVSHHERIYTASDPSSHFSCLQTTARNICITLSVILLTCSCVLKSDYELLKQDRDRLAADVHDLKFGLPVLFADGKKFLEAGEFKKAKDRFEEVVKLYPDKPESADAAQFIRVIDEEEVWNQAVSSNDVALTEAYLSRYPTGKHVGDAKSRKKELMILNRQNAYDAAVKENSSAAWKQFISNYPDHSELTSIKDKIIRLEVDEISRSSNTGELPSFNSAGSSSLTQTSSTVSITNNTGCDLDVRYSGPDATLITIPSASTRTVYLNSGNYKIAASACGMNYAGVENLYGSYNSTFYISTSRF